MGAKKPVKIGVCQGDGPHPGYQWNVVMLDWAMSDVRRYKLDDSQHRHLIDQVKDLAGHENPRMSDSLSLDKVESFFEIRDKGGVLGARTNVRIFFDVVEEHRSIRVLGVHVKKEDGQTSRPVKKRIKMRQRKWDRGEYPAIEVVLPRKAARRD